MKRFRRSSAPKLTESDFDARGDAAWKGQASDRGDTPAVAEASTFWLHILAILALTLTVAVAYVNSFGGDWTSEARDTVRDDPRVASAKLENLKPLLGPASAGVAAQWQGILPRFSYWANRAALGGVDAAGYHAVNFALHWVNCVLLYGAMLIVMRNRWAAFFIAALFGIHPVGSDAVTNIAGRPELLGAMAVLGGLLCCARAFDTAGAARFGWLLLLALFQTIGFASHESAWALPLVVACYLLVMSPAAVGVGGRLARLAAAFAVLLLPLAGGAFLLYQRWLQQSGSPPENAIAANPLLALDALHARVTAFKNLGRYLLLTVWPQTLLPDYSYDTIPLVSPATYPSELWKVVLVGVVLIALLIWVLRAARRNKVLLFFTLFFFVTLLPASNLLWRTRAIMLDRNLYLPVIGFAGVVVVLIYLAARTLVPRLANYDLRKQTWPAFTARVALVIVVLGFGARTFARNLDWQNDERLWTAALDDAPRNYRSHLRLANHYALKEPRDLPRAIRYAEEALRIVQEPGWPEPHLPRDLLLRLGRSYRLHADSTAGADLISGIVTPENAEWYRKSAETLELAAAADRAEKERRQNGGELVRLPAIYLNLAQAYTRLGDREKALAAFRTLRQDAPSNPQIYLDIAIACIALNETAEGAIAASEAIVLRPRWKEAFGALAQLYRHHVGAECTIPIPDIGTVRVNTACNVIQDHLNSAYQQLIANHLLIGDREAASHLKQEALEKYQFPRAPYDALLAEAAPQ